MSAAEVMPMLPILIVAGAVVAMMLQLAVVRSHGGTAVVAIGAVTAALTSMPWVGSGTSQAVAPLLVLDGSAIFFMGLVLAATVAVLCMSLAYLMKHPSGERRAEEYYLLVLLASTGACVLVSADHAASLILGLELLSLSLYGLIGYLRARPWALEAAIKYLILSVAASAFLLFGLALLYAQTGTLELTTMGILLRSDSGTSPMVLAGVGLLLVGVGFKLGIAPFHLWAPDVYQGAPAPVTAFVATVSKAAVFALLLRLTVLWDLHQHGGFWTLLAIMAVLSMSLGNLLALLQTDVKRILAYSSIAHLGYALVAFLAGGPLAGEAVAVYLVAYSVTSLGAFMVVTMLSTATEDGDGLTHYQGLLWSRPWIGSAMIVMLLSLAGIPLTVGFIGKFYAVTAGVSSGLWALLFTLAANSVVGLFYYLRVIVAMMAREAAEPAMAYTATAERYRWVGGWSLAVITLLTVWLGVNPEPLIRVIRALMVGGM